ncbi:MAG: 7TM-DISM domain-containing protein [Cytophagales bacterium]|nr:7TM-DISM domain-containing protein [Cytophagales bacterium]
MRHQSYLYYVAYLLFFMLLQQVLTGNAFRFWLWETTNFVPLTNLFTGLAVLFAVQFTRSFLETQRYLPSFDRALVFFTILGAIASFFSLLSYFADGIFSWLNLLLPYLSLVTALLLLSSGMAMVLRNQRSAFFYVGAWGFMLLGVVVFVLQHIGVLEHNEFTIASLQAGAMFEAVVLSLGLGDRINLERVRRQEEQERAIRSLEEKEALIMQQNEELEQRISKRTAIIQEKIKT